MHVMDRVQVPLRDPLASIRIDPKMLLQTLELTIRTCFLSKFDYVYITKYVHARIHALFPQDIFNIYSYFSTSFFANEVFCRMNISATMSRRMRIKYRGKEQRLTK